MNIELHELSAIIGGKVSDDSHWQIGKNYLIRTVTMIQVGRLEKVTDKELVLSSASWIADTGRFSDAVHNGSFNEIERFKNNVIIGRAAIIDATEIDFTLPNSTK